jgi:hypothetical protein
MYRDASEHVDEHDRAAAAVLMAEALLATCDEAVGVIAAETAQQPERWRAVMQLHDTFPDVWRGLDRARKLLVARGYNTIAYDEMSPSARRTVVVARVHGIDKTVEVDASHLDREALAEAHRAVAQLKLALPSADWAAIEARTRGLASAKLHRHRRPRLIVGVGAALVAATIFTFSLLPNPSHAPKVPHSVTLKAELDQVKAERHAHIDDLRPQVVASCDPPKARTYTQLLVMDGRGADASTFAADYADRCGEDPVVQNWANAPLPPTMRDGVYVIDFPALDVSSASSGTADVANALR